MSTHIIGFARSQLGHLMEAISPVAKVADLGSRSLNLIMPHSGTAGTGRSSRLSRNARHGHRGGPAS